LRAAIAVAAGLPAQALDKVELASSSVETLPSASLPSEEIQRAALLNRLDIRSALSHYASTEARLQLEIAKQYPDITLAPGYSFDQGDNRWSLGLSLILALLNKNEGPIAEARVQREAEASQFYALQTRVIGEQEQALARYRAALEETAKAKRLLAAQQQRIAQTERQFEAGYTDRLELTTTRLELLSAQQGVLAASIKAQRAQAALEDAIQRPLDGDESWVATIEQDATTTISRGESTP
jgi:outer membrane protein TolC